MMIDSLDLVVYVYSVLQVFILDCDFQLCV